MFFFVLFVTSAGALVAVAFEEAAWATEVLLGPYMGEEHAWCELVVR